MVSGCVEYNREELSFSCSPVTKLLYVGSSRKNQSDGAKMTKRRSTALSPKSPENTTENVSSGNNSTKVDSV